MTTQAKHTPAIALDTFEADLLNESPSRRETVTEIQTEDGALLCYAEPTQAARLAHCWNNHGALLEALQAFLDAEGAMIGTEYGNELLAKALAQARAAIQAATANS